MSIISRIRSAICQPCPAGMDDSGWHITPPSTSTLTNAQAVAVFNGDFVAEQGFRAAARTLLRTRSGSELGRILAEEAVAHAQESTHV